MQCLPSLTFQEFISLWACPIFDAKCLGQQAQKNPQTFLSQVAKQVYHRLCIGNLQYMMEQSSCAAKDDTYQAPPMTVSGTWYTVDLTADPIIPPMTVSSIR